MLDDKLLFGHQDIKAQLFRLFALLHFDGKLIGPRSVLDVDPEQRVTARTLTRPEFSEEWNRPTQKRALQLRRLFFALSLDHQHMPLLAAVLSIEALRRRRRMGKQLDGKDAAQQHDGRNQRSVQP